MKYIISLFLLSLTSLSILADDTYKIYPFSQSIEIDGQAKEAVWDKIPFSEHFVPLRGNEKSKFKTRFKLFSNKENLYVLIEVQGQNLEELKKIKSEFSKEKISFPSDHLILYFAPRPEIDDHYCIYVDFHGNIEDCFFPAKAGHGWPYGTDINLKWDSKTKCAIGSKENIINIEMKIPVEPMSLQANQFDNFSFNIQRRVYYKDGKNNKTEDSCWSHVNGEIWDTQKFGLIQGPLYRGPQNFTEEDLNNLDQMTNGMTALVKSLDIYYKAVIKYNYHIPEGAEINGNITNCDHIPLPQYSVKADGYFRFYNAFKYQPYKDLGNHIINKLFKAFKETKDANGKNFLLWNNLMSIDGKVYGYNSGFKIMATGNGSVPFDQSKNQFHLKGVVYQEALGQGLFDLSEIKDTLDTDIQSKLKEMIIGTLDFLHQPYVLVEKGDEYFWRIDAFEPFNPKPFTSVLKKEDWSYLGMDIVLMFMALQNLDPGLANQYIESFVKFSKFYIAGRLKISDKLGPHYPFQIFKLDRRMLSLAKFAKEKDLNQFDFLDQWLMEELPRVYAEIPKVDYSDNGATSNSWSTQGVLEIYRMLGLKKIFNDFWIESFDKNMKPLGIFQGHRILPMNFSSYPLYFNYAKNAFDAGMFNESQSKIVFQKLFFLYGNPKLHRDRLKYALDLLPEQKNRPMWGNTPYDSYVEGVLSEGIYANGSSHALYTIFGHYEVNKFFKTRQENSRYEYWFRYYQYVAPFQYHSDRYSYGKAESYSLINMPFAEVKKEMIKRDQDIAKFSIEIELPNLPSDFPVFGHLDISDILFDEQISSTPTGYQVINVNYNGKSIPFREYQIFDYDLIYSFNDKSKLVFGMWSTGQKQKVKVEMILQKKQYKQYFEQAED